MKITSITYTGTVNLGNYESEKLELTAELEDGDSTVEVLHTLRCHVDALTMRDGWLDGVQARLQTALKAAPRSSDPFAGFDEP